MANEESNKNYGNISGDLFKWVVGAVLGLITTFGGTWINRIQDQQKELQEVAHTNSSNIASLETRVDLTKEMVNQRLDRIETKIDYLINDRNNERSADRYGGNTIPRQGK